MKKSLIFWFTFALLNTIGLYIAAGYYAKGDFATAWLLAGAVGLIDLVYFFSENYPLKFLLPSVIIVTLFLIIPIAFTVYISMTNYSSGHFFGKARVIEFLGQRTFIPENRPVLYSLYHANRKLLVRFDERNECLEIDSLSKKKDALIPKKCTSLFGFTKLTKPELINARRALDAIAVRFGESEYRVQDFRNFNRIENAFEIFNDGDKVTVVNRQTSTRFVENDAKGLFQAKTGDTLSPGYFVFHGFNNFTSIFKDKTILYPFGTIIVWNLLWAFSSVALSFTFGFLLALTLNKMKRAAFFRIPLIIPYAVPAFISVLVWKGLLNEECGDVNQFLNSHFHTIIPWLNNTFWARTSVLVVNTWLSFPYMMLLSLGVLQSIPNSIYESCRVDGIGRFNTFRKITLPLVLKSLFPLLLGSFAFNFNNFNIIYLLTGGNPPIVSSSALAGNTDLLISYTYKIAFESGSGGNFGLASAFSIIIFGIVCLITLINLQISKRLRES